MPICRRSPAASAFDTHLSMNTMKKLFAMLMIAALAIGVTACSDDNEGDDPKGPATTNFNVRTRGDNVLVTLAASDYAIDIPADAAACVGQSEQSEGGVVVLAVDPERPPQDGHRRQTGRHEQLDLRLHTPRHAVAQSGQIGQRTSTEQADAFPHRPVFIFTKSYLNHSSR